MTTKFAKTVLSVMCVTALLTVGSTRAAVYTITTANAAVGSSGPYGTVDVELNALHTVATITLTAAAGFDFGDGSTFFANINGGYSNPTILSDGPANSAWKDFTSSPPPVDGWGNFNLILDNQDFGQGGAVTTLTLTITGLWTSDSTVLALNDKNQDVGGHVRYISSGLTAFAVGVPGDGSKDVLPDGGSTIALLGFGLLGIGALRQRLSRK